jgi:hypothetical protein
MMNLLGDVLGLEPEPGMFHVTLLFSEVSLLNSEVQYLDTNLN